MIRTNVDEEFKINAPNKSLTDFFMETSVVEGSLSKQKIVGMLFPRMLMKRRANK